MDETNTESIFQLPKSLNAFGKDGFKEVLEEELSENSADFPLESCMDNGGWPDTASLEIDVSNVTDDKESIYATVDVSFDELTRHSGCANLEGPSFRYRGTFKLRLSKDDGEGTLGLEDYDEEPDEEDQGPDIYVDEEREEDKGKGETDERQF
jgi:hypothetical protein